MSSRTKRLLLALLLAAAGLALFAPFGVLGLREPAPDGGAGHAQVPPATSRARSAGPTLEGQGGTARSTGSIPIAPVPPNEEPGGVVAVGRVVDQRRRPVPGATVTGRCDRFPEAGARTDPAGRFRLPLGPRPVRAAPCVVHVVGPAGTAALIPLWVGGEPGRRETDLGVITLRPGGGLRLHVLRDGAPVARATVAVRAMDGSSMTAAALQHTDAGGEAVFPALPPGRYRVTARAAGHGRAAGEATVLPAADEHLSLSLGPERAVDVLVVDRASLAPVADATVLVREVVSGGRGRVELDYDPPWVVPPTDAVGRTRLTGLGAGERLLLWATAPGYAEPLAGASRDPLRPLKLAVDATEARLPIDRLAALRWPIRTGDPLAPPEGTVLPLERDPTGAESILPDAVRVEGGYLVAEGFSHGDIQALARAGDGVYARLVRAAGEPEGREVAFERERRVDLHVLRTDGSPAAGSYVALRSQGNRPLGEPVRLDAEGRAALRVRHAHVVVAYASRSRDAWSDAAIGTADLRSGDGRIEGTVRTEHELLLSVRIEGEPGLPGEFSVRTAGGQPAEVLAEDAGTGTLHLSVALDAPRRGAPPPDVTLTAPGFETARAEVTGFGERGPLRAAIDLARTGTLEVRVKPPSDGVVGRVVPERFDPRRQAWSRVDHVERGVGPPVRGGPVGSTLRFEDVAAGRYRVVALDCGEISAVTDVQGGQESQVSLDLSASGEVVGTVEVPQGHDVRLTTLRLESGDVGASVDEEPGGGTVSPEGGFRLRVPGTRPMALTVRHPLLRPDAATARLVLERPVAGLKLRLIPGPTLRFRLGGSVAAAPEQAGRSRRVRVLFFRGALSGTPVLSVDAQRVDDAWRAGGFDPGNHSLWIDAALGAPLLRTGVALGEGETDLGVLEPLPGASVRVRIQVREGAEVPRISAWAQHEGEPPYQRGTDSPGGAGDVLVTGLGPGRFRFTAAPILGVLGVGGASSGARIDQVLEVDGTEEKVVELDLR